MPPVVLSLNQMFVCASAKALPCLSGLCGTLTKYTTSVCFDLIYVFTFLGFSVSGCIFTQVPRIMINISKKNLNLSKLGFSTRVPHILDSGVTLIWGGGPLTTPEKQLENMISVSLLSFSSPPPPVPHSRKFGELLFSWLSASLLGDVNSSTTWQEQMGTCKYCLLGIKSNTSHFAYSS